MKCWTAFLAVGMMLLAAGCVSTPSDRIAREADTFAAFPPDVQARVREGRIEVGFTPDMVRLALGRPARVLTRTTAQGTTEAWVYTEVRFATQWMPVDSGYWCRGRGGRLRWVSDTRWTDVTTSHEVPALRVEFENGAVRAIERLR